MGWALEKASFWRRNLSRVLKQESKLRKEASMRKERSGGYESPDSFAKGVGWSQNWWFSS